VQLDPQDVLSLLLDCLEVPPSLQLPLEGRMPYLLAYVFLVLSFEFFGDCWSPISADSCRALRAVVLEVLFDAVEADVLVEDVFILSYLDVLFLFLLLRLVLPHAVEHLFQVGVHLLVQSALDGLENRQVGQTHAQEVDPFEVRHRLRTSWQALCSQHSVGSG
jgi:hypothetical protein